MLVSEVVAERLREWLAGDVTTTSRVAGARAAGVEAIVEMRRDVMDAIVRRDQFCDELGNLLHEAGLPEGVDLGNGLQYRRVHAQAAGGTARWVKADSVPTGYEVLQSEGDNVQVRRGHRYHDGATTCGSTVP